MLVNQPSSTPTNKVAAGLSAGLAFSFINFLLGRYNLVLPPELAPVLGTVLSFVAAWFTKDKATGITSMSENLD